MHLEYKNSLPIYEQIITEIKRQLVREELKLGEQLPSQHDLALKFEVNPNTIHRAYREMENRGLVESYRGRGTFIKEDKVMVKKIKQEMVEHAALQFVQEMRSLGIGIMETTAVVQKTFNYLEGKK